MPDLWQEPQEKKPTTQSLLAVKTKFSAPKERKMIEYKN